MTEHSKPLSFLTKLAYQIAKGQAHFCTWNKRAMGFTGNLLSTSKRKGGATGTQEGPEESDATGTVTAPGERWEKEFLGCKERPQTVPWSCGLSLCCEMVCAQCCALTQPAQTSSQPSILFSYHAERGGGTHPAPQELSGTVLLLLHQTCTQQHAKTGRVAAGLVPRKARWKRSATWSRCNPPLDPPFAQGK